MIYTPLLREGKLYGSVDWFSTCDCCGAAVLWDYKRLADGCSSSFDLDLGNLF